MKRVIASITSALIILLSFWPSVPVMADQTDSVTPSGIAYSELGNNIDQYIADREAGLASCGVSVFDANGIIYSGYYGYSDIENQVEADSQTVYEWASTSKILVWVSVMQQAEKGAIDLNEDIREYLPEGFLTKLQYPDEKITMLNLMNHNAGFQESFYENQEAAPDDVYVTLEAAVRACECYQAFHVGEYTAYSNWGTALAAYIVECTSGQDYVTYVNENIFNPLGMEHTSIDPLQRDNEWVAAKRAELKCYARYAEEKYNEDLGVCRYAVQLFPAGSAIGTLEDLTKLGQALSGGNSPLFEDPSTLDEMLSVTSCYGDSDIAKNCHGLWVQQRKVMTAGHDGNSAGCTTTLEFDPISGLGIVIMTNEPGETAFTKGIPVLIFGHYTDRGGVFTVSIDTDVSGIYYTKRHLCAGPAMAGQYIDSVFPLSRNDDGTYSVKMGPFTFSDGFEFICVGKNQYIMVNNGMEQFIYIKDGMFDMGYMDYVRCDIGYAPTVICYGFMLFGVACMLTLLVKLVILLIRHRKLTIEAKQISVEQLIYGVSGIIYALFNLIVAYSSPAMVMISGILALILAVVSLINGAVLFCRTIKADATVAVKTKQFIWSFLSVAYTVFLFVMQVWCFWKL